MGRLFPILVVSTAICGGRFGPAGSWAISISTAAEGDSVPNPPAMDRVQLAGRVPYEGLIESEDGDWIQFIEIKRPRGQPMHLIFRPIQRRQVTAIVRLEPQQREALRQQVERFRNRAAIEAGRMEAVSLKVAEGEGSRYRRFEGRWFTLDSTADEWTARLAIVRAEQIFAAFRQVLPPRAEPPRPPRLIVFDSSSEYQALLARMGLTIDNRACFVEKENLVAVACDLAGLRSLADKVRLQNDQVRQESDRLKAEFNSRLDKTIKQMKRDGQSIAYIKSTRLRLLQDFEQQMSKKLLELRRANEENERKLRQMTSQFYTRLYHESFHAYLENYVYPHRSHDVPYWLNEGLAVMYEGAVLDGEILRFDATNATMLKRLKEDIRKGRTLPLAKLLAAGSNEFLSRNNAPAPAAEQHYSHAWGLVYYLAIEKRLLGSPSLDDYVSPAAAKLPPDRRFEKLVGMPLDQFEAEWEQAMLELR